MTKLKLIKIDFKVFIFLGLVLIPISNLFLNLGFVSVFISVSYPIFYLIVLFIAVYSAWNKDYVYIVIIATCLIFYLFNNLHIYNKDSSTKSPKISVLTYNVNAFKHLNNTSEGNASLKIVQFINNRSPDICILQEFTYKEGLNIENYSYQFLGFRDGLEKSLLTIFSKYPIIDNGFVDFPNTRNNAIYADVLVENDTIRIYNTHLQSYRLKKGLSIKKVIHNLNTNYSKQIEQATILKSHANKGKQPTIICGDFNATRVSRPYKIINKGMRNSLFFNIAFIGNTYELFSYPVQIDHILYNDGFKLLSHENFELNLSDHEPILVNVIPH